MSSRKPKYQIQSFESLGKTYKDPNGRIRTDTSANIYESMLQSEAYKSLTDKQKNLYLICKAQYFGKRKPLRDYPDVEEFRSDSCFYLNWAAVRKYGLYTDTMSSNFYKDMQALIDNGFIDRLSSGKCHHAKTVYKYSCRWRKAG